MKKFLDDFFKPYFFPILLAFITVYFRESLNFTPITNFFVGSSSKILKFFSAELYLWQIILYGLIIYFLYKIYNHLFLSKSKQERRMIKATERSLSYLNAIFNNGQAKFHCKYKLSVADEEYIFDSFTPYCITCSDEPLRMSKFGLGDFRCNCGIILEYNNIKDIKSRILTDVEKLEY